MTIGTIKGGEKEKNVTSGDNNELVSSRDTS